MAGTKLDLAQHGHLALGVAEAETGSEADDDSVALRVDRLGADSRGQHLELERAE